VLWLEVPRTIDLSAVTARLKQKNVLLDARLAEWFFNEPHLHGTRINFAQESIARTRLGLELLAQELRREFK
jgi:DNA-binding transcriptional MocR family regulator